MFKYIMSLFLLATLSAYGEGEIVRFDLHAYTISAWVTDPNNTTTIVIKDLATGKLESSACSGVRPEKVNEAVVSGLKSLIAKKKQDY